MSDTEREREELRVEMLLSNRWREDKGQETEPRSKIWGGKWEEVRRQTKTGKGGV